MTTPARKRWLASRQSDERKREFVAGAVWDLLLFAALVCLIFAAQTTRARGDCYLDPVTGQRVCSNSNWVSVGTPIGGAAVGNYGAAANVGNVGVVVGGAAAYQPAGVTNVQPLPSRCRIFVADGSLGSGTLISESIVLTCSHLFSDSQAGIVCQFPDGRRFGGIIVATDPVNDLAAVRIVPPGIAPAVVSPNDPSGVLIAGGFGPNGIFAIVEGAVVGQYMPQGASEPALAIQGANRPGDSGGAVVDQSRAIVGVAWGCKDGCTYLTCGRPLRNFVQRVLGRQQTIVVEQPPRELPPIQPVNPPLESPPVAHGPELVPAQPPATQPAGVSESNVRTWIADAIGKLERGPKGDRGEPGPPGAPGVNGVAGPAADTSKLATKDEVALAAAAKVAQLGFYQIGIVAGLSTGGAGIAAWLASKLAMRGIKRVLERHQTSTTAGGPSNTGFRSY